jgi:hypothetical protein
MVTTGCLLSHVNCNYRVSVESCPCTLQLSQDVPSNTGALCIRAVMLSSTINETLFMLYSCWS